MRDIEDQNRKESSISIHSAYVQSVYDTMRHRACESQSAILAGIARVLFAYAAQFENEVSVTPPKNFEDAMSREDWDDWCYATDTEINGMTKMDVFSKESYTIDQLRRIAV